MPRICCKKCVKNMKIMKYVIVPIDCSYDTYSGNIERYNYWTHKMDVPYPDPQDEQPPHPSGAVIDESWHDVSIFEVRPISMGRQGNTWSMIIMGPKCNSIVLEIAKIRVEGDMHLALFGLDQQRTSRDEMTILATTASTYAYDRKETVIEFKNISPGATFSSIWSDVLVEGRFSLMHKTKVTMRIHPRPSIIFEDGSRGEAYPSASTSNTGPLRHADPVKDRRLRHVPPENDSFLSAIIVVCMILLAGLMFYISGMRRMI